MKRKRARKGREQGRAPGVPAPAEGASVTGYRSWLKYVYLAAFFMLLSGFFHPIITGTSYDSMISGTLVLFLGLAGGVLLYAAATSEEWRAVYLGAGFGLVALSLAIILVLTGRF